MIAYLLLLWLKVRSWADWSILELTCQIQDLIVERSNLCDLLCPEHLIHPNMANYPDSI